MNAVFWGLGTAFGWGIADFLARFTSRGFGTALALAAMLFTSSVILTLVGQLQGETLTWHWNAVHLLAIGGLGTLAGTGLLYWGLARGPVSLVAPIVASYPAFNLLLAVSLGIPVSTGQWALIAVVMAGVITVSRASGELESPETHTPADLTKTTLIALASSVLIAAGVAGLQFASAHYGEWGTLIYARWIAATAAVIAIFLLRPSIPAFRPGLAALLVLQGLLDGGAYLAILFGSRGAGVAIVVVVASAFTIVTLLLARIILKERIGAFQTAGVAMVVGGVAGLAYIGAT